VLFIVHAAFVPPPPVSLASCCRPSWVSRHCAALRVGSSLRAALLASGVLSSSLRSSSTRAVGLCLDRRVGCLRWLVVRGKAKVKVNGASGGPAQKAPGDRVAGCGFSCWCGWGPVVVPPSPVPGGNQGPAGGATGGGARWLSRGFSFAGCAPGRTLIGLRRPGEGGTTTSEDPRALRFGRVAVHLRGYFPSPRKPSPETPGCKRLAGIYPLGPAAVRVVQDLASGTAFRFSVGPGAAEGIFHVGRTDPTATSRVPDGSLGDPASGGSSGSGRPRTGCPSGDISLPPLGHSRAAYLINDQVIAKVP
jgi:hypothetical protein